MFKMFKKGTIRDWEKLEKNQQGMLEIENKLEKIK